MDALHGGKGALFERREWKYRKFGNESLNARGGGDI